MPPLERRRRRIGGGRGRSHQVNVVLGLISSKLPALEPKDAIKRRIDEAARYIDLGRLHLSPQCGFACTQDGNLMNEDEQWRKLAHVVEIAEEVWPR